ncbi:MAG: hypothetical protein AAGG75_04245 [Bacteroidota bacterium]
MMNKISKNYLSAFFLLSLILLVGCQKDREVTAELDQAQRQVNTIQGPITSSIPSPGIPCFNAAAQFGDLAFTLVEVLPSSFLPVPFTDDSGTLDNYLCPLPSRACLSTDETILFFGQTPYSTNPIAPCDVYCIPYGDIFDPVSLSTQETIYNKAIAMALDNRPTCSETDELMEFIDIDFYTGYYIDFDTREELATVEFAVRYACCSDSGSIPN